MKGFAAGLASVGVGMAIGMVIDVAASAIDNFIHRAENGREALNNFYQEAKESQNELDSQKEWITTNGNLYEKLSKGVDKHGHNISLTADEFSKYNSMVKEIVNMFPSLKMGYNEQGTAILKNKGDVEDLTKAYEENQKAYYASVRVKSKETFDDYKDATSDDRKNKENLEKLVNEEYSILSGDIEYFAINYSKNLDTDTFELLKKELKELPRDKSGEYTSFSFSDFSPDLQQGILDAYVNSKNAIETESEKVKPLIDAFLYGNSSGFNNLDEKSKEAVKSFVNNIEDSFISQFDNSTDLNDWLRRNVIQPLQDGAKSTDLAIRFQTLFALNENDYDSYQEYVNAVNDMIEIISQMEGEDGKKLFTGRQIEELKAKTGVSGYDSAGNAVGQNLIDNAKEKFKNVDGADKYIETLSEKELRVVYSLEPENIKSVDAIQQALNNSISKASANTPKPTFQKAFSSLESNDREELLAYAKAGKLTPDVLSSNQKYADILKAVGGNAELAARKIKGMVSSSDQLATMKTGITSITDIIAQKKENYSNPKTKNVGIGADILAAMPKDVKACTKEYKYFCNVLGDGSSGMSKCQNAANKLASAYVNSNNFLSQLDDSSVDYNKSLLKQMGVTNADEIVTKALARSKALAAFESYNLSEMSAEEIEGLIEETAKTEDAASALRAYALDKVFANGKALNTKEDITQLMNLLDAFGIAAPAIKRYQDYLNGTYNTSEPGGMDSKYLKNKALKEVKKAIKQIKKLLNFKLGDDEQNHENKKNPKKEAAPKEAKQEIDWMDRRLTSINNKLTFIQAQYENIASTVKNAKLDDVVSKQNKNLNKQIKILNRLYHASSRASSKYAKKANSVKISKNKAEDKKLKGLVKSETAFGKKTSYKTLIKKYGQSTADKITEYQNWYDKSINAKKSAQDYKKQITEKRIQKYQNSADFYQASIDKQSARKEVNTNKKLKDAELTYQNSAAQKKKHIDKQIEDTNKLYAAQKNIAKLEGNNQKVAQLEAERRKAIVEYQIENLQNYADEKEAAYDIKNTQASMTTDYKKKNTFSKEAVAILKSQYKYLTDIAKKQGDSVEAGRLELELTQKIREAQKERIENIAADYENRLIANNRRMQIWENASSLAEAKGMTVTAKFYQAMADVAGKNVSKRQEELNRLMEQYHTLMKEHQNDPSFSQSQEFLDIVNSINEESDALEQEQINFAKLEQQAIEANWSIAESAQQAVNSLNDEAEALKTIFESRDMFDKDGAITEEGTTVFALNVYEMQNHIAKIREYYNEIDGLNRLYREGKISPEKYSEQMQKLKDGVLDSTQAVYSMRDALKSMVEEGLNGELDALNDMIDRVKKNLSDAGSLREYKKNIEKQTKNIASLERQIDAKMGDTSESGRATVQKLKVQLEEAKSELEDTEYDKYIEDQERILDDLSDDFQNYLDGQLEQVDTLLEGIISAVESGRIDISDAIKEVGSKIGVDLSKVLSESLNAFATTGNGEADKVHGNTSDKLDHSADAIFQGGADKLVINTDGNPGKLEPNRPGSPGSSFPRPTEEDLKKLAAKTKSMMWLKSKGYSDENIKTMYASLDNAQELFTGLENAAGGMSAEDIYNAYWKEMQNGHAVKGAPFIDSYSKTQPYIDRQNRIKNNDKYANQIAELLCTNTKHYEHIPSDVLSSISKYGSQKFMEKYHKGYFLSSNAAAKQIDSLVKKIVDEETGKPLYQTSSASDILHALINLNNKYGNALSNAAKGKISAGKIVDVGGFSKGGIVDTSTLSKIAEKNGDDGWVTVKSGEGILSPIDTQNILALTELLRGNKVDIPEHVSSPSGTANLPIPNNAISTNNTMNGDMNIHLDGSNIKDFDTFADAYINCFQHSPKMRSFFFNGIASGLTNDSLAYRR